MSKERKGSRRHNVEKVLSTEQERNDIVEKLEEQVAMSNELEERIDDEFVVKKLQQWSKHMDTSHRCAHMTITF